MCARDRERSTRPAEASARPPWRALAWLTAGAFVLRLAALAALGDPTGYERAAAHPLGADWCWAFEEGAVARALTAGRGFADPFLAPTGPTAWTTPVYPALLASLLALHGGLGGGAALGLALVQAALSAAIVPFLAVLGGRLASRRAGLLAAGLWAVHPTAIYFPVAVASSFTLSAFALAVGLERLTALRRDSRARDVAVAGACFGAIVLVNASFLSLAPLFVAHVLAVRGLRRGGTDALVLAGAALAVLAPWMARNHVRLGSPSVRSVLGVELYVGNNPRADGEFVPELHPSVDPEERRLYATSGEVEYSSLCRERAFAWIRSEPGSFARLTLRRIQQFWLGRLPFERDRNGERVDAAYGLQQYVRSAVHAATGVAALLGACLAVRRTRARLLVLGTLLLFPLVYYATHVLDRYRFPIEPVLILSVAIWLDRARSRAASR